MLWGDVAAARKKWPEATVAYQEGIMALRTLMDRQLTRDVQDRRAAEFAGLAEDAAACSLHAEVEGMALLALEFGRGVILGSQLDLSVQQRYLATGDPRHATRMTELLDERRDASGVLAEMHAQRGFLPRLAADAARRSREASEQMDRLLAEQRDLLTGDLGRVATAEQMAAAARHGPLVLLNINRYRSDAIIVSRSVTVRPNRTPWKVLARSISRGPNAASSQSPSRTPSLLQSVFPG